MIDPTDISKRPEVYHPIKESIKAAFTVVPEGKNSAVLAIADSSTRQARLHAAWKINDTWKVGAQIGWAVGNRPNGYIGVEAAW